MIIIREPIAIKEIREKHADFFETMVKIVVDTSRKIVVLNAQMHADLEQLLLEENSLQQNLWGANIYFDRPGYIEFTSLINIRPAQGNRGMEVSHPDIRKQMEDIVYSLIIY